MLLLWLFLLLFAKPLGLLFLLFLFFFFFMWFGLKSTLHKFFLPYKPSLFLCQQWFQQFCQSNAWQIFWVLQIWNYSLKLFRNYDYHLWNNSRIRKINTKESYFADNAKKSVRIFLDCLWFFHFLHLKFSDQIQYLHLFDPFISFVFLLKKISNSLGCFQGHYSGKHGGWDCYKQSCSCFWFYLFPLLVIFDLCKSWIV